MATRKLPPPAGSAPQSAAEQAKNWLTGQPENLAPTGSKAAPEPPKTPRISSQGVDLSLYEPAQLLELRALIDTFLPIRSLKHVNMEQELVIQLLTAQKLQLDTLKDDLVPANQKAQVINSVAGALATLAKMQVEVFDSERLKKIESCLIDAMNTLPMEAQEVFMVEYERTIGGLS